MMICLIGIIYNIPMRILKQRTYFLRTFRKKCDIITVMTEEVTNTVGETDDTKEEFF